jgi:hypothetical protein
MITFNKFLESTLSTISNKKISINLKSISLNDTKHSKERLTQRDITQKELIRDIESVTPLITSDLANGEISGKEEIWIHNSRTQLNIIVRLNFRRGTDEIIVITVMRKKGFKSKNQKYIVGD